MATASIVYEAVCGYNGAWGSWGNSSAYFGNNSTNNYAAAIRFRTPAFSGTASSLSITIPIISGYSNSSATVYASLTTTNPTYGSAYTGNTPGSDSARIYCEVKTFSGLSSSLQYAAVSIPTSSIRPSTTYYLVLSADRPAANAGNYAQLYAPSGSSVWGSVSYTEFASTFTVSADTAEMGSDLSFTIERANTNYLHRLSYRFGGTGAYTVFAENVAVGFTWTVPIGLAASIPTASSGTWQICCETYNGSSLIGDAVIEVELIVPASVTPRITEAVLSMESENYTVTSWGIFVQGYSALRVQLRAEASYSTIRSWLIQYADGTFEGEASTAEISVDQTSEPLITTGELAATITATDARGRTVSREVAYKVEPYAKPSADSLSVYRSTVNGNRSDLGTYIAVTAQSAISDCDGHNTREAFALAYKERGAAEYGNQNALADNVQLIVGGGQISTIKSYNVRITISDRLETTYVDIVIPTQRATMNAKPGGLAVAFGKYAEADQSLELAEGWSLILNSESGQTAALDYETLMRLLNLIT